MDLSYFLYYFDMEVLLKTVTLALLTSILTLSLIGCQYQTESKNEKSSSIVNPKPLKESFVPEVITTPTGHWTKVWEDSFDDIDTTQEQWNFINREKNYNNELESYLPENATISDGLLHLTAKQEKGRYTSGQLTTQDKFSFQYGRVEIRAKYPTGKGLFPAIWMMPKDATKTLPEIDLFEAVGDDPHTIYSVHHTGTVDHIKSYHDVYHVKDSNSFHVYTMEWTQKKLQFYVDNHLFFTSEIAVPQESMYLILNLAVGGNWPGVPNSHTPFPSNFDIDYIKVFSPKGE